MIIWQKLIYITLSWFTWLDFLSFFFFFLLITSWCSKCWILDILHIPCSMHTFTLAIQWNDSVTPTSNASNLFKKNKNKTKNKRSSAKGITENINGHKMVIILFFKECCCPPTMWGHPHISTPVQHTKQVLSTLQETVADVPLFPFQFPFAFKCHYFPCLRVCPSPWGVRTSPEPPHPHYSSSCLFQQTLS